MKRNLLVGLTISHFVVGVLGFALGTYTLPILIAPPAPTTESIVEIAKSRTFTGEFKKNLEDSDRFHWGEGTVSIGKGFVSLEGELAPGPDYKLYLSKEFVETEDHFNRIKLQMRQVGDIKTFDNFIVDLPMDLDPADYNTVIVWCETFGEFITAARYQ